MSETSDPAMTRARRQVTALRRTAGSGSSRAEIVAEETPVALVFNGLSFAVMMATPVDLEDFARGFALTEGLVEHPDEIFDIEVTAAGRGIEVRLKIAAGRFAALRARQRALAGRTGCGLCGVDSIDDALRPVARVTSPARFEAAAIIAAMAAFPSGQVLNAEVGAIHAAAFADQTGQLLAVREDVGRHNALDKLIGAIGAAGIDAGSGFVVVSSRCSYELVHKTAAAGVPLIAAVSAPTGLAIDWATAAGIALVAFARDDRFNIYAGADRLAAAVDRGSAGL